MSFVTCTINGVKDGNKENDKALWKNYITNSQTSHKQIPLGKRMPLGEASN